jgi:hypothetical protein
MSTSKCIVRLKDCHNTEHSVEVYAESLYEAVLRGLGRLEDVGWEAVIAYLIRESEFNLYVHRHRN